MCFLHCRLNGAHVQLIGLPVIMTRSYQGLLAVIVTREQRQLMHLLVTGAQK